MILGDEIHQWKGAVAYNDLHDRMGKRQQPLCWMATNSGESRASFCWQLRVKAMKAIEGTGDVSLYPIIWAADENAKSGDPKAWRAANPLLGTTMKLATLEKLHQEAVNDPDPSAMTKFRRLYLSIWPKSGGGRWLNMAEWDKVEKPFNASDLAGQPLYVGLDMLMGDDLCAAAYVFPSSDAMRIDVEFWVSKATAER